MDIFHFFIYFRFSSLTFYWTDNRWRRSPYMNPDHLRLAFSKHLYIKYSVATYGDVCSSGRCVVQVFDWSFRFCSIYACMWDGVILLMIFFLMLSFRFVLFLLQCLADIAKLKCEQEEIDNPSTPRVTNIQTNDKLWWLMYQINSYSLCITATDLLAPMFTKD